MVSSKIHKSRISAWRINLFIVIVFVFSGAIIIRLFDLTYLKHAAYVKTGQTQYNNPSALISGRGDIYTFDAANGSKRLVATNRSFQYVYATTTAIVLPNDVAGKLAPIINKEQSAILAQLTQSKSSYQVLADHLSLDVGNQIKNLKLKGITVASQIERFYPRGSFAAPVIGFVGFDGEERAGQYGVESYYDDVLSGELKTQNLFGNKTYSSVVGFFKNLFNKSDSSAQGQKSNDGSDVVLTIDDTIQSFSEAKINETVKRLSSPFGTIIVEDPTTGAVMAMASSPSFDPNNYADYKLSDFLNKNIQELFEPGSSFKPITMSAAVDSAAVTPDTTYEDSGILQYGTYTIRNFDNKAHGVQTMRQVLEHSLNTGAVFAEGKTGDDAFLNYVVGFGFGQKTGVDLPGEINGNISNLYSGRKINFATASFGQGIAVTPLQLISGYSAIANNGKLMRPFVVKEIMRPDGTKVETAPKIIGAPITEKTSNQLKSMLVDVVEKGFDKARIKGYDIAGKTGTAQIPDGKNGYLAEDQFIHNFVGFAPAFSPRFVVLIRVDKPKGIKFAADSLSPVFGDMARFLIHYFNIPPSK